MSDSVTRDSDKSDEAEEAGPSTSGTKDASWPHFDFFQEELDYEYSDIVSSKDGSESVYTSTDSCLGHLEDLEEIPFGGGQSTYCRKWLNKQKVAVLLGCIKSTDSVFITNDKIIRLMPQWRYFRYGDKKKTLNEMGEVVDNDDDAASFESDDEELEANRRDLESDEPDLTVTVMNVNDNFEWNGEKEMEEEAEDVTSDEPDLTVTVMNANENSQGNKKKEMEEEAKNVTCDEPDLTITIQVDKKSVTSRKRRWEDVFNANPDVVTSASVETAKPDISTNLPIRIQSTQGPFEFNNETEDPSAFEPGNFPLFQQLCTDHFFHQSCGDIENCGLEHAVTRDFEACILRLNDSVLKKTYDWVKDTPLYKHVLPCYLKAFCKFVFKDQFVSVLLNIVNSEQLDVCGLIRMAVRVVKKSDLDLVEIIDKLVENCQNIRPDVCMTILEMVVKNIDLLENWSLVEKLIHMKGGQLPTHLVTDIINVALCQPPPFSKALCKLINDNIFRTGLAHFEDIPEMCSKPFKTSAA